MFPPQNLWIGYSHNKEQPVEYTYISDRIRLLSFYIESNIANISNDVGLCLRLGQISNGSKFVKFSMKFFGGKSFLKMHFAKSLAIREKTNVIL